MSLINVNTIEPSTGTTVTLGASGDTFNIPSGVTLTNNGTMNASAITAGTLPIARGGTGSTSTTFVNAATNISGNLPVANLNGGTSASSSTFWRGDGAWVAAGESNTPYFEAKLSAGYAITSTIPTLLAANSEVHDSGGCYNNTAGSVTLNGLTAPAYSFTPNVAGKYFVYFVNGIGAVGDSELESVNSSIYFNGSQVKTSHFNLGGNPLHFIAPVSNAIITCNGTGDYIQFYTSAEDNSGNPFQQDGDYTQSGAFKVSST